MKKKIFACLLLASILLCSFSIAFAMESKNGIKTLDDLNGKKLGVQTGVLYEDLIKDDLEGESWAYYKMPNDMIMALESQLIDAYLIEEVGFYAQHYEHPELMRLEQSPGYCEFAVIVGANEKQDLLYSQIQEFIKDRKANGWLDELYDYWVKNWDPNTCVIREIPTTTGENGSVSIAIEGGYEPFSFESNGEFSGYDVEFMMNFCAAYGYSWDFKSMEFDSIANGCLAGKYDFGMNIVVDEERADASVLSDPYYVCDIVFVVEGDYDDNVGFFERIQNGFYKTFIKEDRWELFIQGVATTLIITLCSMAFGTLLGFAAYMSCRHDNKVAKKILEIVTFIIDGCPTVVFLMLLSFVVFAKTKLTGTAISVVGFTFIFGCGMYDMLNVGCNAIPIGQTEASRALGYSDKQSFFKIILPQAAQHFMPIYKNDVVDLIKETSIVGYIAVMDLTKMSDLVRSRTYEAFFALIASAIIYFLIEGLFTFIISRVQIAIDPHRRSKDSILKGIKEQE